MNILNKLRALSLVKDTRGLSTVEYVILIVLIAAVAIGVWGEFGSLIKDQLSESKQDIETEFNENRE
jgi:Flp pilus assembly pilin Flp